MKSKATVKILLLVPLLQWAMAEDGMEPWFYNEQWSWGEKHYQCNGDHQSPIDIHSWDSYQDSTLDEPFKFNDRVYEMFEQLVCENSGQTYTCRPGEEEDPRLLEGGGGLMNAPYKFLQFHFNFGSSWDHTGSDHKWDGEQFPGEVQLVFMTANEYGNDIMYDYGSLIAMAWPIVTVEDEHFEYDTMSRILGEVYKLKHYGNQTIIGWITLADIFPFHNDWEMGSFWRYQGSIPYPPCYETVQWTVFKYPIKISESLYRGLTQGHTWGHPPQEMYNSYRWTQELNDRMVSHTSYLEDHGSGGGGDPHMPSGSVLFGVGLVAKIAFAVNFLREFNKLF